MTDFNTYMQQHEMGVAYKRISEEMGPSAQLIAFVNYDKINFDEAGLESLEVDIDHQLTLEQIDNGQYLELAYESLANTLDKISKVGAVGTVAVNIIGALVAGPSTAVATYGIASVMGFGSAIAILANYKNLVWQKSAHDEIEKIFNQQFAAAKEVVGHFPSGTKESDWEKFANRCADEKGKNTANPNSSILHIFADIKLLERNKVIFEKSGWSTSNIKDSGKWLIDAAKKTHSLEKDLASKAQRLKSFVELSKEDKDDSKAKTAKYISSSITVVEELVKRVNECLRASKRVLDDAARHFGEEKEEK